MSKVVLYTRDPCPFCTQAKSLLSAKGVDFEEIKMGDDENLQEEVQRLSGRRTVPQIFLDGKPLGGYQEIRALDATGELDELLASGK